jgi:hypothetical protein
VGGFEKMSRSKRHRKPDPPASAALLISTIAMARAVKLTAKRRRDIARNAAANHRQNHDS